ncbi:MAG: DUF1588 domain-containing protein [Polyangiaceae bacterium]|nr:DUF1588 domain-containing protein [Polyangiaceae bacterium]
MSFRKISAETRILPPVVNVSPGNSPRGVRSGWPIAVISVFGLVAQGCSGGDSSRNSSPSRPGAYAGSGNVMASGGTGSGGSPVASSGGTSGSGVPNAPVDCATRPPPAPTPLRRLTLEQYQNSVRELLAQAPGASKAAEGVFAQLPVDGRNQDVFTSMDDRVSQSHVDGFYNIAKAVAGILRSNANEAQALSCPTIDQPCFNTFVRNFGLRAFRRPLLAPELARYGELFGLEGTGEGAVAAATFSFLMAPEFLYRVEVNGTPAPANALELTLSDFEKATRLAHHFWHGPPDAELLSAAEKGQLSTPSGFEAELLRVAAAPQSEVALRRFWGQWLGVEGFHGFVDTPAFRAFAGTPQPGAVLADALKQELWAMVNAFTWQGSGTLSDLFTTTDVFATSPELAAIYGVPAWDGTSKRTQFGPNGRTGLLTRAGLLVSGNELTNPIKRGAFVLKHLQCVQLSPPANLPAEALALPTIDPKQSTRQRFAAKTSPAECAACHTTFNPYGFAFEEYDALGRLRTTEKVFDDAGTLLAEVPVDASVTATIDNKPVAVKGAADLSAALATSDAVSQCIAQQYFAYTFGRPAAGADQCVVAELGTALKATGLNGFVKAIAKTSAFQERVIGTP